MGKQSGKNKKHRASKSLDNINLKQSNAGDSNSPKAYDKDTAIFISFSQEHKDEGNKLFQKKDYEGSILKYEKALKLLPCNHVDVSYLHSNMAACYMQMGISDFPRAIHECNLALEVTPKYSKALLKRARCYEALGRLDLALRDVNTVLDIEPKNLMAIEIADRVKVLMENKMIEEEPNTLIATEIVDTVLKMEPNNLSAAEEITGKVKAILEKKGGKLSEEEINALQIPEYVDVSSRWKSLNEKVRKKKKNREKKSKQLDPIEEDKDEHEVKEQKTEGNNEMNSEENCPERATVIQKIIEDKGENNKAKVEAKQKNSEGKRIEDKKIGGNKYEAKDGKVEGKQKNSEGKRIEDEKIGGNKCEEKNGKVEGKQKNSEGKRIEEKKIGGNKEKNGKVEAKQKKIEETRNDQKREDKFEEKKTEDKLVVEEKISTRIEEGPKRSVKLAYGEDIRWAKIPVNCDILELREIICNRFPVSRAVLIKYRDEEGDMVTVTTNEELRWAESSTSDQVGSFRLYIVEVNPEQDPFFEHVRRKEQKRKLANSSACIDDWILQFARLFKNYVGFDSDAYVDLHELGMKLYSEAMEDTVTSEEAQELFSTAADKFQEMAALALFNWGNVHMSRARKRVYFTEDASRESVLAQVKESYEWAQVEYRKAGERYKEALQVKPDFYEGVLALGQQQFEQAKLSWYYVLGTNVDLETWDSTEVLQLYNNAEDDMEKGMQMWEEAEKVRANEVSRPNKVRLHLQKIELGTFTKDNTKDEAAELAASMRSQINVLWGTMLYERSIMEYKLDIPVWHECLEAAVEKFELAGASHTDIAVMLKNHCSNDTAPEGLGFHIDEIVQAWNEMYEAKRWESNVPSFRLEPLLRRRVSKLFHALEQT